MLFEYSRKKEIYLHPAIFIFWILSPLFSLFSGAAIYDELLKRNHLEIYHENEYVVGAGLLSCLSCFGLNVILLPIFIKLFPRLFVKVPPFYWVIATYVLPVIVIFIEIAIEGLPWDQRVRIP